MLNGDVFCKYSATSDSTTCYVISYLGDVLSGVLVVSGLVAEDSPMSTGL